jgi:hypothetical protein
MANSIWQATAQTETGDIIPGAKVTVSDDGTGLNSTIYSTIGGAALANPFTAQPDGFIQFYAPAGVYRIKAENLATGQNTTWNYVRLGSGASLDIDSKNLDSLTSAVAFVTSNPLVLAQVSTASYRSQSECTTLGISYPDGGGADYVVEDAGVGSISAGSKSLSKLKSGLNSLKARGGIPDSVTDHVALGINPITGSLMVIRHDTTNDPAIGSSVQIQRLSNSDEGFTNPKALRVLTEVSQGNGQTEWAISGELVSNTDSVSTGNTAVSGVSTKNGTAQVFGGHFQVRDNNQFATPEDVTSVVGVEINAIVSGKDHPTKNSGNGDRQLLDLIAISSTADPLLIGETGVGLRIRCDDAGRSKGYLRIGISLEDGTGNPNPIETAIRIRTSGEYGIRSSGIKGLADVLLESSADWGLILAGTYVKGAIRLSADDKIAFESTGNIECHYDSALSSMMFANNGTDKMSVNVSGSAFIRLNGTRVVSARKTGWSVAGGPKSRTTFNTSTATLTEIAERLGALIDDMHETTGHGLIGA